MSGFFMGSRKNWGGNHTASDEQCEGCRRGTGGWGSEAGVYPQRCECGGLVHRQYLDECVDPWFEYLCDVCKSADP